MAPALVDSARAGCTEPAVLESLLERCSGGAHLALDEDGRLLYRSPRAAALARHLASERGELPTLLACAARRLLASAAVPHESQAGLSLRFPSRIGPIEVALALARTAAGRRFVHVEIHDPSAPRDPVAAAAARHGLTPAEARVLSLLGEGLSNADIGRTLRVSVNTVRTHVQRVLDKLSVRSRAQAALAARGVEPHR